MIFVKYICIFFVSLLGLYILTRVLTLAAIKSVVIVTNENKRKEEDLKKIKFLKGGVISDFLPKGDDEQIKILLSGEYYLKKKYYSAEMLEKIRERLLLINEVKKGGVKDEI